ncbi:MAG: hypothetical protein JOY82_02405 [Streptosporangiaceae bacterium]|nr:hypothetical protein [Streptosporangiaceae bacterium]MBV9853361.1 hypothetical protein [Streptosporangiaceae bacterium]
MTDSGMTKTGTAEQPSGTPGDGRRGGRSRAAAARRLFAALAGSAVLGLPAGLIWGAVAPRALLQEVSQGTAQLVNAESSVFIGADGWFCAIAAAGGVITGVLGYRLLIYRRSWGASAVAAAALIIGALAAALIMLWTGEQMGLSAYQHQLASAADGTLFSASLGLGAKTALAFWPMFTSIVIVLAEMAVRRPRPSDPGSAPLGYGVPPE